MRVVVETRRKQYPRRDYIHRGIGYTDAGGSGSEVVREANLCIDCFMQPAKDAVFAKYYG